jgi:hypothetical protein
MAGMPPPMTDLYQSSYSDIHDLPRAHISTGDRMVCVLMLYLEREDMGRGSSC